MQRLDVIMLARYGLTLWKDEDMLCCIRRSGPFREHERRGSGCDCEGCCSVYIVYDFLVRRAW